MAEKKGAGGAPQEYDEESGQYGSGTSYRQNTSYDEILKDDKAKAVKEKSLTEEENKILEEYNILKKPIKRRPEDEMKWAQYDKDYETYSANEPQITADMDIISKQLNMPLIGRDFRLKGKGSYDRKVNDKRLSGEYKPLGDVVRYTFEHSMDNAPKQINANLTALKNRGYKIVAVDNKWKQPGAYNGINVDVVSPSGVPMEIQYTTFNNHKVKEEMHKYYEIARDGRMPLKIKELAERKMNELSRAWESPKGIKEI